MDKKDIYEHLAKIYLDASSKKKKNTKDYSRVFKNLFLISVFFIFGLSLVLYTTTLKEKPYSSETALVLLPDATKINFHFDPAKKETFALNLNRLDLSRYKSLAFRVKKANYLDNISMRVEFINAFKEKSEIYFKDLTHRWQEHKINLSSFKGISDWSEITAIVFTIEEWNVKEKRGVVYVDNIRLLR